MKAFTPAQHKRVTAIADNAPVLEFARRLAALQAADVAALRAGAGPDRRSRRKWSRSPTSRPRLGVVERAEVLPFHQMGRFKWERLGLDYKMSKTEPPSQDMVAGAVEIFRAAGLQAH